MDVVRRILDLTGASPDLVRHVADRPGHDRRYSVDSTKLRDLGWAPQHSFDAGGLEETVEWYRENRDWWEPIKSGDYKRYYERAVRRPARLAQQRLLHVLSLRSWSISLRAPSIACDSSSSVSDVGALAERVAREGEVVVRVRLVERAAAVSFCTACSSSGSAPRVVARAASSAKPALFKRCPARAASRRRGRRWSSALVVRPARS